MDRAKLALHGADGNKCGCEAVKQRRHGAKAGSHPHSEEKIRQTNEAHSFRCVAVCFDVQDYGPEAEYLYGTRYDLVGYCVTTAVILCIPMKSKDTNLSKWRSGPGLAQMRISVGLAQTMPRIE